MSNGTEGSLGAPATHQNLADTSRIARCLLASSPASVRSSCVPSIVPCAAARRRGCSCCAGVIRSRTSSPDRNSETGTPAAHRRMGCSGRAGDRSSAWLPWDRGALARQCPCGGAALRRAAGPTHGDTVVHCRHGPLNRVDEGQGNRLSHSCLIPLAPAGASEQNPALIFPRHSALARADGRA